MGKNTTVTIWSSGARTSFNKRIVLKTYNKFSDLKQGLGFYQGTQRLGVESIH